MELSFFNLRHNPFVMAPAPDRLFLSRSHLRGMQEIAHGIEGHRGIIALLAPRGRGKTTLVHAYLDQRLQRNVVTIGTTGRSSTFAAILGRLCAQFNVPADGEIETTLRALRSALRRVSDTGCRVVLLIDEAEGLSAKVLEDLFLLADMEDGSGKLLTILLIGEPELDQHLKRACAQTLRIEGYRRIRIEPLRQQESIAYVQHRIAQVSGDEEAMFTPRALHRIARYAQGNPGLLNHLCNEALRTAIIEQQKPIAKPIVRAVLNDLEGRQPLSLLRWGIAALAGVLVVTGVSMGSPHIGRLWHQPDLKSIVAGLVNKVKSLPSLATPEDTPRGPETPDATAVDVNAPPIPASDLEPQMSSPSPETSLSAAETPSSLPEAPETLTTPDTVAPDTPQPPPEPPTNLIVNASLLCLTARPPGNHARDIILVDYHGKVQQRLVSDGALNLSPILSPDQRRLAYTSYREGTPSIYVRDLKGDKDERLTSPSGIALPGAWSPDGRYLALSKSEDGNSDIFLYDLKRRQMRRLTLHQGIDVSPSFAPDSERLVFTSSRSGSSQIYLTDVNGRSPERLTREGKYNAAPVWSPQGGWIAFIGRSPEQTLELYIIRDDGTKLRRVTIGGSTIEDAPAWSPDGRAILYTRVRNGIRERRIVDRDGRHDRELPGHGQVCYSPQWVAQLTH
ncbi:AAA family ATPase [Candidatus Entotheonella palauensis]|uniref:AAA family ATPase n=1 Tax=Candidatus Entotheonella palauensis TaxID=93172 RepID=UPI0015C47577|nr:AAA family ATPase [Candidatus Entotheonella palauensis]